MPTANRSRPAAVGSGVDPAQLAAVWRRAHEARARLLADPNTTACRLWHGDADGIDGLVIEKLGDVLIAQLHEQRLALEESVIRGLCVRAAEELGARAVYRKVFPRERSQARERLARALTDPTPWWGRAAEPEFPVLENGMRLLVRPYDGYSTGLFLEQRDNRQRVRTLARGRRVLNAFAYTCGFTVAATLGGAAEVVSLDLSKRFLEWGRRNLAANGLAAAGHTFICDEIFAYYRRARRQERRFDLIILDPPTFARAKRPRRAFSIARDLEALTTGALELLDSGGDLLISTNHRGTTPAHLERTVSAAASSLGRPLASVERLPLPEDFRGDPDYAKAMLARVG